MADRVGQQLGNYRLLRLLGEGAYAAVYLGEHQYLERLAAIKVLHVRMEPGTHKSFLREARTIAQLHHPHIINVHDFGFEDQTPYLVMEYVQGGTLRSRYPKGTLVPFEQMLTYVKQIASALDYAHEKHVIHRDVKPENILLNAKHEAILSDFGIAVVKSTLDSLSTQELLGTPAYMAPEQIQQCQSCAASDQYALGVMIYEWLCGEPPFRGQLFDIFNQHVHTPPPSLCARLSELPPAVEDAVFGALAKDPEQRFVSATDFAMVLSEAFFATQTLVSVPKLPGKQEHPYNLMQPQSKVEQSIKPEQLVSSISTQRSTHGQIISHPVRSSLAHSNRLRLLRRVRSFWITGVLEQSLHGAALLALGLHEQPDAVVNPWHLVIHHPDTTSRVLPTGTRITQVYDTVDGELLILGAPGAGKTTLLLELARDLLNRAEYDELHPMPVVFNLSSWAMKQQTLVDWLVEELNSKYQVPRKLGQALVDADQILPLLDGLDEVNPKARTACIEAINTYRQEHGLLPLVVCSRSADYLEQSSRLLVRNAVMVQPLTPQQADTYLSSAGKQLESLRFAIYHDPDLQQLATTPLMLNILTLAYRGTPLHEIASLKTLSGKQQQVFATYVQRMLTRLGNSAHTTPKQTVHWLTYLAQQMRKHNQTLFYLENLQPDWLAPGGRRIYTWLGVRLPNVLLGMLISLSLFMFIDTLIEDASELNAPLLIIMGTLGGLLGILIPRGSLSHPAPSHQSDQHITKRGRFPASSGKIVQKLLVYLIAAGVGLSVGLGVSFSGALTTAPLSTGLSTGLSAGASCILISFLLNIHAEGIQLTERLRWTWRSLMGSLFASKHLRTTLVLTSFVTIIIGLSFWRLDGSLWPGLIFGSSAGLSVGPSVGLSYWFLSGLCQGISLERIEEQQRQVPGQGIRIALRGGVLMGGISWGVLWLTSTLSYGLSMWLYFVLVYGPLVGFQMWQDIRGGPSLLLSWALTRGLILGLCGGLIVCLVSGGLAAWRHCVIRLLLQRTGMLPLRCVRFFDRTASCILLQKVGGGYSFVHRLLLDYFAR